MKLHKLAEIEPFKIPESNKSPLVPSLPKVPKTPTIKEPKLKIPKAIKQPAGLAEGQTEMKNVNTKV